MTEEPKQWCGFGAMRPTCTADEFAAFLDEMDAEEKVKRKARRERNRQRAKERKEVTDDRLDRDTP